MENYIDIIVRYTISFVFIVAVSCTFYLHKFVLQLLKQQEQIAERERKQLQMIYQIDLRVERLEKWVLDMEK